MFDKTQSDERIAAITDRRHARRYPLAAPVLYRWRQADGSECHGGGFTRDVGAKGTFINCEEFCPPIATIVSVEILLPSLDADVTGLKLKAEGLVVRSVCFVEGRGFAIETDFTINEGALAPDNV